MSKTTNYYEVENAHALGGTILCRTKDEAMKEARALVTEGSQSSATVSRVALDASPNKCNVTCIYNREFYAHENELIGTFRVKATGEVYFAVPLISLSNKYDNYEEN